MEKLEDSRNIATYLEADAVKMLPAKIAHTGILRPFRYATGGTVLAAELALEHGIAINIGGGYHHARPDTGGGFCIYADMPIAIRKLQAAKRIERALIVDLDVHQGDGTVACLEYDEDIFTFSMHEDGIYPISKATSDLDINLSAGTDDETYMKILEKQLPRLFEKARPDIVFFQAGCDTLYDDPLANLEMTEEGIVARDAMVIDECVRRGIPVVMVLGGGYSNNAWRAQYRSICRTIEEYGTSCSIDNGS